MKPILPTLPSLPLRALLAAVVLTWLAMPAAAQVYRWTDESGRTHYGRDVPERYRASGKQVQGHGATVAPDDQAAANARREKGQALLNGDGDRRPNRAVKKPGAPAADQSAQREGESDCERQWRVYRQNEACFSSFRLPSGDLRSDAFQKCKELPQPTCS